MIITLTAKQNRFMPSQRKKGLKLVGAYVDEDVYKALKAEAKRRDIGLADLIRQLIQQHLKK